jgi:hypothetical protein
MRNIHLPKLHLQNLKGIDHLEDLGVDGKILKWTLNKWVLVMWTGVTWLRISSIDRPW